MGVRWGGPSVPGSTHSHMTVTFMPQEQDSWPSPAWKGQGSVHSSGCVGPRKLRESGKVLPRHDRRSGRQVVEGEISQKQDACMCLSESLSWGKDGQGRSDGGDRTGQGDGEWRRNKGCNSQLHPNCEEIHPLWGPWWPPRGRGGCFVFLFLFLLW